MLAYYRFQFYMPHYCYKCDLLFSVCGIQYLIYGFVFPSVYGILCIWKKEILKKLPNLNKTKFKYYTTAILYSLFALYVVSVPRKINFFRLDLIEFVNNFTDLCKKDLTNHAQKNRQNTKDESFKYLLDKFNKDSLVFCPPFSVHHYCPPNLLYQCYSGVHLLCFGVHHRE